MVRNLIWIAEPVVIIYAYSYTRVNRALQAQRCFKELSRPKAALRKASSAEPDAPNPNQLELVEVAVK